MLNVQKSPTCKIGLGFDKSKTSTSGTKLISFARLTNDLVRDESTLKADGSTIPGSVDSSTSQKEAKHVFSPPMSSQLDFVIFRKKLTHNSIENSKRRTLKPSLKNGFRYVKTESRSKTPPPRRNNSSQPRHNTSQPRRNSSEGITHNFLAPRTAQSNGIVEERMYMILFGADNRPPMLDKDLYDSWKSRMELYMQNRKHERMILESIENGPLVWPTVEENGVTRTKKYAELSVVDKIQADYDMKKPISFFKVYQLISIHLLIIIELPKIYGKEFNY
uniref:Integrase, catalytic region, zinc finger, CCHC-type, peptidase aspartic, catalytic n=1 Tax=Tanacetum cinerariifolium TaxID=118510 RepID=A0A6L2NLZ4_TANCI|nr:hypothetical protein [Tanacetum cinerariifolium]